MAFITNMSIKYFLFEDLWMSIIWPKVDFISPCHKLQKYDKTCADHISKNNMTH